MLRRSVLGGTGAPTVAFNFAYQIGPPRSTKEFATKAERGAERAPQSTEGSWRGESPSVGVRDAGA